jgi:hypothetical protein
MKRNENQLFVVTIASSRKIVIFQKHSSAIFRRVFQYSGNGQPRSAGYIRRLLRSRAAFSLASDGDRPWRSDGEKCGGRKSYAEAPPEMVELARQLRRPDPDRRPISLSRLRPLLSNAAMSRQLAGHTKLRPSRLCSAKEARMFTFRSSLKSKVAPDPQNAPLAF